MRKTSAWPLSQICVALIVYASLYPFDQWRDQGIWSWSFLAAPWPKYWLGFDVVANVLGYAPLGFFLTLSVMRMGWHGHGILVSTAGAAVLSLTMEGLQSYLPARVLSLPDFLLNTLGAFLGAAMASALEHLGWLNRWSQFKARWFVRDAHMALVLIAVWPAALLFPVAVPLGLGQVWERVEDTLTSLERCRKPVLAAIHGACVGGGLEMATMCDMRICGNSSRFGVPINKLGLVMAYAEIRSLIALAGEANALEILLEGRVFDAQEALRGGLLRAGLSAAQIEAAQTMGATRGEIRRSAASGPWLGASIA